MKSANIYVIYWNKNLLCANNNNNNKNLFCALIICLQISEKKISNKRKYISTWHENSCKFYNTHFIIVTKKKCWKCLILNNINGDRIKKKKRCISSCLRNKLSTSSNSLVAQFAKDEDIIIRSYVCLMVKYISFHFFT